MTEHERKLGLLKCQMAELQREVVDTFADRLAEKISANEVPIKLQGFVNTYAEKALADMEQVEREYEYAK